ncbi:MAG: ferric reductase-like transmembrane domain-containing protein [Candidatus Doudnabacteria bacterium]|nr:ferric reductase-like transmembrane domain-containing protein [Candidatus Doudnabacteria bacterium]
MEQQSPEQPFPLRVAKEIILDGKIYIPRTWIERGVYYGLPVGLVVMYAIPSLRSELHGGLGTIAELLLLLVLLIKPAAVLVPKVGLFRTLLSLRRPMGIAVFYFAAVHVLIYAALLNTSIWKLLSLSLQAVGPLWYGAVALLVLLVLFSISNKIATKRLKRWWKRIQRLAYLALPLVLVHAALVENEGIALAIVGTIGFIALKSVEWYSARSRKRAARA